MTRRLLRAQRTESPLRALRHSDGQPLQGTCRSSPGNIRVQHVAAISLRHRDIHASKERSRECPFEKSHNEHVPRGCGAVGCGATWDSCVPRYVASSCCFCKMQLSAASQLLSLLCCLTAAGTTDTRDADCMGPRVVVPGSDCPNRVNHVRQWFLGVSVSAILGSVVDVER